MQVTTSGSCFAAAARGAQAVQIHRDGNADEASTQRIEPIVVRVDVIAKKPRQQAENESEGGDGQQAPDLWIARTIEWVHFQILLFRFSRTARDNFLRVRDRYSRSGSPPPCIARLA